MHELIYFKQIIDLQSEQKALEEKDQPLSLSNLLSYFTGKKEEKEQQKDRKPKSIKTLLRNLQMKTNLDPETSEHIKKIIAHIEAETKQKKMLPSNLKERGHLIKRCKLNNGKAIKNETDINKLQQDMVTMLKEQKELMCTFQADINQLRHEISSQVASDCGGSAVIRRNDQLESTTIQSIRESTPQLKEPSFGVPQDQRKQIPMPFRKNNSNELPVSNSSQTNPAPVLPSPKVSTPVREQHFSNLQPPDVSRHNMTATSESIYSLANTTMTGNNPYILENVDERPALEKYPKRLQNKSFQSSVRTGLLENFHNQVFKQTSTFEKVEQWRQTLPRQPEADVDVFKVPIGTPASNRRKSLNQYTPMSSQRRKRTPNDSIGKQKQCFEFLEYAPKKPHHSQKRREEGFHDNLAVSLTYTPEDKKVPLDQTKRILNFPQDARRKIGFKVYEDVEFERQPCNKRSRHTNERQSSSSSFVEGSSKDEFLNDEFASNDICNEEGRTVNTSGTCVGCDPNHLFLSHNFDCRNIILFFTTSTFSCQFHREYIAKYKNLICKKVSKRQKQKEVRHLQAERNYAVKDKEKWENLSVFSFRSGTDMKKGMDDDQMSGISVNLVFVLIQLKQFILRLS